ncbi:MAG: SGNH/GDSL hydrolase family protein [Gammaproteobacteria bacterium]
MNKISKLAMSFLSVILTATQVQAGSFSSMVVFGDSLSDAGANPSAVFSVYKLLNGNCDPGHPCPPYYQGRYSNGPVTVEYLADMILPGGANQTNFFDFAIAGSTSAVGNYGDGGDQSTSGVIGLPAMRFQVNSYLQTVGENVPADMLHVVWGGANDFLTDFSTPGSAETAAKNIAGYVDQLATMGADNILVANIPDLSLTPFVRSIGDGFTTAAQAFSLEFNHTLFAELNGVAALHPETHVRKFDTFSFFNGILANPAAYGFTNVADACVGIAVVCGDPDSYIYWDDFHPTTHLHALMASALLGQVPLPGAVWLFSTGLLVLVVRKGRSRGGV